MKNTRDQLIQAASELLEIQGYCATSLGQILERSGAPKGSLYYHFPGGKDELVAAAVEHSARTMADLVQARMEMGDHPAGAVAHLVLSWAERIRASDYRLGSLIATVALEAVAVGGQVDQACRQAYRLWQVTLGDGLLAAGYEAGDSERLAIQIVSSLEGATLLSRVERSTEPLIELADELFTSIIAAGASSATVYTRRPILKKTNGAPLKLDIRRQPKTDWRSW